MVDRRRSLRVRLIAWWVACSLAFGIVSALLSDRDALGPFLLHAVVVGATWGLPVTLVVLTVTGRWDRHRREREGLPPKGRWDPVTVRETLVVDAPPAVAFDRALGAVARIPKARVKRVDRDAGVIEASVGMPWQSGGERLIVRVRDQDEGGSEVDVVSEPRLATTIYDYGKNQRNVDTFFDGVG